MTSRKLLTACRLAMASAFLTIPLVYLSFRLEGMGDTRAAFIQAFIQICGTALFVAIVLYLKKMLNALCNFHDTDRNLDLLIIASVLSGGLSIAALCFPPWKEATGSAVIVILVAQGIVQMQFGYRLRRLPYELGGLLRPFCYLNMTTGLLLATIILLPLGIVVSAITDLMLGTIFYNCSRMIDGE